MAGLDPAKRYGGEKICAFGPPTFPPAESTRPSGSSNAVEWYPRYVAMLAITVNCPVAGSHISVGNTGWVESSNPEPLLPPTTKTVPSGRRTALCWRRGKFIEPFNFHAGVEALRSIDSVVAVGGSDPPRTSTFPESYITPGP